MKGNFVVSRLSIFEYLVRWWLTETMYYLTRSQYQNEIKEYKDQEILADQYPNIRDVGKFITEVSVS